MTGKGWVNGSDVISKPWNKAYDEGWERIFGKKKEENKQEELNGDTAPERTTTDS